MKNQLLWALCSFFLFIIACSGGKTGEGTAEKSSSADTAAVAPAEFADAKYADIVRNSIASLSKGDVASWLATFSDDAVYAWNNGDSLAGKAAISEYWTKRRSEVLDTLFYENQIFLPIKINTPQSIEAPGVWVLAWAEVTGTYKPTGKSMTQWMHWDMHFNSNDKIDRLIQYSDRVPINAALTK